MNAATLSPDSHESHALPPRKSSVLTWLAKAQSLTMSTLIHAVLVMLLGGTVLFQQYAEPPDFTAEPGGLVAESVSTPQQQQQPQLSQPQYSQTATAAAVPTSPSSLAALTTNSVVTPTFAMASSAIQMPAMRGDTVAMPKAQPASTGAKGLSKAIAAGIASFTGGWAKGGTASYSQPIKSREFEFTAYLAKYQGGDWDSTVQVEDGQIWAGSLPNFLFTMGRMSKKKLKATPQAVPLDLSSTEIFDKKPPFIWFTGHRDFKLTDKEVANLGEYLRRGGCIWGDSSLPGRRSRFDIAFRREMLRLVPDPNQPWQALPANHPVFTKAYYSEIKGVAPGMNFYDEPIYTLEGYGGEIAVLYTANDYGDMWQFGLDEEKDNKELDLSRDEKRRMVACNEQMYHRRNLYFRNIEPEALMKTYKFGTNIVIHLLTRWEDKVRFVQQGNPAAAAAKP